MDDFPVVALCDARGDFPEPLESAFPALGETGPWRLHIHCFLLRLNNRVVLVDTGTGPAWAQGAAWFGAADPRPTFPNARYLVPAADAEHLAKSDSGLYASHVKPLAEAGLLDLVSGVTWLTAGVRLVPAPGHTPGHQCVVVEMAGTTLLISGDAFVHPAQVADLRLAYRYENDPETAAHTRRSLLATPGRLLLAPAHFDATVVEIPPGGALREVSRCP